MKRVCYLFRTLLLPAGLFGLISTVSPAAALQPDKDDLPQKTSGYNQVSGLKAAGGLSNPQKAKEAFAAFAKFHADYVGHPKVYLAPQEFRPEPPPPGSSPPPYSPDFLITEINRHILVPLPGSPIGRNDADYIRELGIALDTALKEKIENGELIVRINAMRLLAAACRSGATVHYPTLTAVITNANTPPGVKYYAYQAAANLLAAYDFNDYRSRKHTGSPKEVSALIAALQDAILKPEAAYPNLFPKAVKAPKQGDDPKQGQAPAGGNLQSVPVEQQQVVSFLRRQAVRALGQVRFADRVPQGEALDPAFTLGRIAVSDPAIFPAPSATEVAEAVIGICNMAPPRGKADADQYGYAMSDVVATGVIAFARPRAGNPGDKTHPWRGYAARVSEALKGWGPLFDPAFDPTRPGMFLKNLVPAPVIGVVNEAERRVIAPMDGMLAKIDLQGLQDYRDNTLRTNKQWTLVPFKDQPNLVLPKGNGN